MKSKIIFTLLVISILIVFNSCRHNPVSPAQPQPGRRDYVWSVDTLKVPADEGYLSIIKLWGDSPKDIWAVGWAYINSNCVWHFDGVTWKPVAVDRYISPFSVYGFGPNDVWIAGTDGAFWHYDGVKLSRYVTMTLKGYKEVSFEEIRGKSPYIIYAVGSAENNNGISHSGIIAKFNGSVWSILSLRVYDNNFYSVEIDSKTGNLIIISDEVDNDSLIGKVYRYNGNNLKVIYKGTSGFGMGKVAGNVYVTQNRRIYKYEDDTLKVFKDFSTYPPMYLGRIWGRSETDFFTQNVNGWIGHYNGSNLVNLFKPPGTINTLDAVIFSNDVFLIGIDLLTKTNIIIHGKLKYIRGGI